MKYLPLDKCNQKYQPCKQFLPGCEFSAMSWWLLCSTFDDFFETYKDYMKEGNVFAKQKPANAKHLPSTIYEECVCRGTPSIGIITNSGLISNYTR